jgi:glycosyltransferase involved in cell wall biosynthesis
VINLLLAVRSLDPERYTPTVLFYEPSPFAEDFQAAGARVQVLDARVRIRSPRNLLGGATNGRQRKRVTHRTLRQANLFVQRDWPRARRIAQVIREVRADLVQTSVCPSADRAAIFGAWIARIPQVCYVQYWTDFFPPVDVPLSWHIGHYLCISDAVRKQLRTGLPASDGKASVAYAPFEFGGQPSDEQRLHTRGGLGVNRDEVLVANVGRLVPWKGHDVFLRAFREIASHYPRSRAIVVGGPTATAEGRAYAAELERLTAELGVADRVFFTGHRGDVGDIMAAADIVVHSSSEPEPLGRVIMEAVALCRPVIATGAGGVPEMVSHGDTGWLVPPGDVRAMAEALSDVLERPAEASEIALRARATAEQRFGVRKFGQALESVYERTLQG